jgi:hypothetical protein
MYILSWAVVFSVFLIVSSQTWTLAGGQGVKHACLARVRATAVSLTDPLARPHSPDVRKVPHP